jgi:hypothetical protein
VGKEGEFYGPEDRDAMEDFEAAMVGIDGEPKASPLASLVELKIEVRGTYRCPGAEKTVLAGRDRTFACV